MIINVRILCNKHFYKLEFYIYMDIPNKNIVKTRAGSQDNSKVQIILTSYY